jgi:hypothetical protein
MTWIGNCHSPSSRHKINLFRLIRLSIAAGSSFTNDPTRVRWCLPNADRVPSAPQTGSRNHVRDDWRTLIGHRGDLAALHACRGDCTTVPRHGLAVVVGLTTH